MAAQKEQHDISLASSKASQKLMSSPEELSAAAREYFSRDFPNPERVGCPNPEVIGGTARSGLMPDDELRAHLFGCSECFREYCEALSVSKQFQVEISGGWLSRWLNWRGDRRSFYLPALASALALVLGFSGYYALQHRPRPGVEQRPQSLQSDVALKAAAQPSPTDSGVAPLTTGSVLTVRIDLNEYGADPDANRGSQGRLIEQSIYLPAKRVNLRLRLRRGSPAGSYRISLIDAFDQTLITRKSFSRDGKNLLVELNLKPVHRRGSRLRLQFANEVPDDYPIKITPP